MTRQDYDRTEGNPDVADGARELQRGADAAEAPRLPHGGAPPPREGGARRRNCLGAVATGERILPFSS